MENNQKKIPLNIQRFAESGDGGVASTNAVNVVENNVKETNDKVESETKKEEKTYTRDEVNKIISAERDKVRDELIKETEAQKTEAEKLAKMDAEQKAQYELEKEKAEKKEVLARLNAYELKEQATKIANDKELDISLFSNTII